MHTSGIMIGSFEPLHLGHMRHILHASGFVQTLHILITPCPTSNPSYPVTLQDKARWLQMACADLPFIRLHICEDIILPAHHNPSHASMGIDTPADATKTVFAKLKQVMHQFKLPADSVLVLADNHPLVQTQAQAKKSANLELDLAIPVLTTPSYLAFDSHAICQNPVAHWDAIHPEARGDYTRTVAIVGGESSGKTTLLHKLANYYGADFALEMGRLYVGTDLGGSEVGLQYSDYAPIAIDHAHAVREAIYQADAPVTLIDTDFVTTQAFCEEYEGRTHPFVTACIDEFRFDHTIFLANNTPWVADGMRSLGSASARERFENKLDEIFARHNITPHRIISPDYQERFEQAVAFIDNVVYHV